MMPAYVLTVDGADGPRARHAREEIEKLGVNWQFVDGVTLSDLNDRKEYSPFQNFLFYRRNMTPAEVAVYLGHRLAWRKMLADGASHALILEDDFQILDSASLRKAISDAAIHNSFWDIIKFFDVWSKRPFASVKLGETRFVCRRYPPNGAVAYLISASAARALLSRSSIYRPVDEDISRPWEFSLCVWSSEHNLVTETARTLGGSVLNDERESEESLRHKNPFRYILMRNLLEASRYINSIYYKKFIFRGSKEVIINEL